MFESAELGHSISKRTYAREVPKLRAALLNAQSDAVAADAGEHPVADEVGVKAVDFSCADAREFEKQSVDLRLAAGLSGIGIQRGSAGVVMNRAIKSYTPNPARIAARAAAAHAAR